MKAISPTVEAGEDERQNRPIINEAVIRLLRSPIHRLADSRLCELRYHAPKSGREVSLPVMYAPWDNNLVVLVGHSDRKQWWRAFRSSHDVAVYAGPNAKHGRGVVLTAEDARFEPASAAYQRTFRIKPKQTDRMVLIECAARRVAG